MEEASLADKSWQLSGEIGATGRPENSLLEEHLMYDQTVKLRKCQTAKYSLFTSNNPLWQVNKIIKH